MELDALHILEHRGIVGRHQRFERNEPRVWRREILAVFQSVDPFGFGAGSSFHVHVLRPDMDVIAMNFDDSLQSPFRSIAAKRYFAMNFNEITEFERRHFQPLTPQCFSFSMTRLEKWKFDSS